MLLGSDFSIVGDWVLARLEGKVCIVTGAAAGIGRETAGVFAGEGADVVAIDIDEPGLSALAKAHPEIRTHVVDVRRDSEIQRFVDGLTRIDVLFNCAGRVAVGTILECSEDDWQASIDLNVTSLFRLTRAVLPKMLDAGSGSIVNMASVISSIGGAPDRFAYGVSKGAVIGMTKSIARDFSDKGIRCNAICPSSIETPSMSERIAAMDHPEAAREAFNVRQPVGRMGTPREVADLATYLASDESDFMTGSALVLDGGAKI